MNEVKKCSISGIAFTMDKDAHSALRRYIDTLQEKYGQQPDGEEIIADIEARIAELILSTQDNARVVELPLIENIIAQLGSADAISEESDTESEHKPKSEPRIPRRLYRDMEGAKLGGVCAGIGRYFDIDPVWIRLAIFVPLLITPFSGISAILLSLSAICGNIFGVFLLTYLILWFAIPVARTPRQKLEMKGEKITEQSIRESAAAGNSTDADTKARPVVANTVTALGGCLLALFKIFAAIVIFALSMAALALIVGIIAIISTEGSVCDFGALNEFFALTNSEVSICILGILAVLVPIVLLLYVLICLFMSRRPNRTASIAMFVLWIVIFFILCLASIRAVHQVHSLHDIDNIEQIGEILEERAEQIEDQFDKKVEQIEDAVEKSVGEGVESVTITTTDGTKISVFDTEKNGGNFRQTTINIDK